MKIEFDAWDYTKEDTFQTSHYVYEGDEDKGWKIFRNGELYLTLEPGYRLLKTKACGICSTDIDRRFLPFPLPQIIGHELIAQDMKTKENYVVEINDTLQARGSQNTDPFIQAGIPTHSPTRMVLGIDRLPGGFGPYILAPKNAIVPIQGLSNKVAVVVEPFAASLQAIEASPPMEGDKVAILGPRRLGNLIIAALSAYRKSNNTQFQITAITRRNELSQLAIELGADNAINIKEYQETHKGLDGLIDNFDIVYDTSATPEGFSIALSLASREVHLKTTNGQKMCGLQHLTELVVDELSILPFTKENLQFHWPKETRKNTKIYIAPSLNTLLETDSEFIDLIQKEGFQKIDRLDFSEAVNELENFEKNGELPRYDVAVVSTPEEIDRCIRPIEGKEMSLIRPRGAILYIPYSEDDFVPREFLPLELFFRKGGCLRSSRCGNFERAIQLLKENPDICSRLEEKFISHIYSVEELPNAYNKAKSPDARKVMVVHSE